MRVWRAGGSYRDCEEHAAACAACETRGDTEVDGVLAARPCQCSAPEKARPFNRWWLPSESEWLIVAHAHNIRGCRGRGKPLWRLVVLDAVIWGAEEVQQDRSADVRGSQNTRDRGKAYVAAGRAIIFAIAEPRLDRPGKAI